jgi:hypothetical protein
MFWFLKLACRSVAVGPSLEARGSIPQLTDCQVTGSCRALPRAIA